MTTPKTKIHPHRVTPERLRQVAWSATGVSTWAAFHAVYRDRGGTLTYPTFMRRLRQPFPDLRWLSEMAQVCECWIEDLLEAPPE